MRPLSPRLKKLIDNDSFFRRCLICGAPPQINHNFKWAGRQINEPWALTPLCDNCHKVGPDSYHKCKETRERVDFIALNRATDKDLAKYPRSDLSQYKKYLISKYS